MDANRKAKKLKTIDSFFRRNEASTSEVAHPPAPTEHDPIRNESEVVHPPPEPDQNGVENEVAPPPPPERDPTSVELNVVNLECDPGKRIPSHQYPANDIDAVRRAYIKKKAFQPILKEYLSTLFGTRKRRFQKSWFKQYPWLEYSPTKDAAYCFPCFLFDDGNNTHNAFTLIGYKSWKRVNDEKYCPLLKHAGEKNSHHCNTVGKMNDLENTNQHIGKALDPLRPEVRQKRRLKLMATVESIRWLTLQACALRGHRESSSSNNQGNLIELIKLLRTMNGDLNDVTAKSAQNATYVSPMIQKEILHIFAERVRKIIREEIGDAYFCILVDEAKDIANRQQMAIVLRFVDAGGILKERFFEIVYVKNTVAATLKNEISNVLSQYDLQICNMRGQGYDGASNMRGSCNGLQALFCRECPYAYHIHCFAHRLQLALVAAAEKSDDVWCFFQELTVIASYVSVSPKRHSELLSAHTIKIGEAIATGERATGKGLNQLGIVHQPGKTRWSSHYASLCDLVEMYDSVIVFFTSVRRESNNNPARGEARKHLEVLRTFNFVFILHMMHKILTVTDMLCRALQRKSLDILSAMNLVSSSKALLQELKDGGFGSIFLSPIDVCERNHIDIPVMTGLYKDPEGCVTGITFEDYYRVEMFYVAIDCQIEEINYRFADATVELLKLSTALDPKDKFKSFQIDHIHHLAETFYPDDFSKQELQYLRIQMEHYKVDVLSYERFQGLSNISELCRTLSETNKAHDYHLIDKLIRLVLTLPVTTATTERAFSAMKRVKSVLRNKMKNKYLSDSMVLYIERELSVAINANSVIDEFYAKSGRRERNM